MAWIESHQSLGAHPKTKKLARLLNLSPVAVVGHLHYVWWWAMDYAPDGNLAKYDDLDIAIGGQWDGDASVFVAALITAGFIDPDRTLHDWSDYGGKLVQRKKANAERMREARADTKKAREQAKKPRATHVQRTCEKVQSERREQDSREENVNGDPPPSPPETANAAPQAANVTSDAPPKPKPFDFLQAVCDETGGDVSDLSARDKGKQCKAAERLIADGVTVDEAVRVARWLLSQSWVQSGVDLTLIENQIGKWRMNGRPDGPRQIPARASPSPPVKLAKGELTTLRLAERAARLDEAVNQ